MIETQHMKTSGQPLSVVRLGPGSTAAWRPTISCTPSNPGGVDRDGEYRGHRLCPVLGYRIKEQPKRAHRRPVRRRQ